MKTAVCVLLIFASTVFAGSASAPEILNKVGETYKNLKAYEFVATRTSEVSARGVQQSGESHIALSAVKPDKYRLTIKDPAKEVILVADGEVTWTYAPKLKQYTKQQGAMASEDEESEPGEKDEDDILTDALKTLVLRYQGLARYAPVATLAKDDKIKVGGDKVDCYVVQLRLPKGVHQLWVDKQRSLVLRHVEITRTAIQGVAAEFKNTISWKQAEIDLPPANDLFSFEPPPNTTEVPTLNLPGERPVLTGKAAVDFALKDTQGNQVRLSELRGKIVLLDFWATWCPPCRRELPSIEKLNLAYKDKDVVVLGINDEEAGTVKGFLRKNEYTLTTLMDSKRAVHKMYGARAIPTVIVIDRNGVIKAHYVGARSEQELVAALKTAGL